MYDRDDNMHERTRLTDDHLSQCINELKNVITACQATIDGKSFLQACRDVNLDPEKTGSFLADRLMKLSKVRTPVDKSITYDGYKHFYIHVFGENRMKNMTLPPDYKESVLHVLNDTGLSGEGSDLVQKRFGIGSYDRPSSISSMAGTAEGRKKANAEITRTISECRDGDRPDILVRGLACHEKERHRQKTGSGLSAIMDRTMTEGKRDVSRMDPDELKSYLKGIPVRELGLIQPTVDSLKSAGIRSVHDVLCMTDEDISNLPVMHEMLRSEIRTAREMYAATNFNMNLSGLMSFLPDGDDSFTKAVESMWTMDTSMEQ